MKASTFVRTSGLALAVSLFVSGGAHATEQWSTDLWSESPAQGNGQSGGQTSDGWWSDDSNGSPSDASPGSSSGSGLWSDDLWSNPPPVNQPVEKPKPVEEPKPAEEPKPVQNPQPVTNPDPANSIIMQVGNPQAVVRGQTTELGVPPFTINGRAMIPLRFIGEALKATVAWSEAEQQVTMELNGKKAQLWVNQSTAVKDGQVVPLDFPPMVLNGTTLVPLRFIGEFFGYQVNYDAATQTITIVDQMNEAKPEPKPEPEQEEMNYEYFGEWALHMDGLSQGMPLGTLTVNRDGTYAMNHSIYEKVQGSWRLGAEGEVIGFKEMLILEKGPTGIDWVMIPKQDGIVSVRYHHGYSRETKIWIEDCLGIRKDVESR